MRPRFLSFSVTFPGLTLLVIAIICPLVAATEPKPLSTYDVHGTLKSLDPAHHQATIAHEAIAGYMPAMTMAFDVRDWSEFQKLQPGDILNFHLCITHDTAWIEHIEKTGTSLFIPPPATVSRELNQGDLLPDVELVDEQNKKVHLSDYRGNTLAITFIYTGCPLPTYCPLINQNFQTAQTLLARLDPGEKWRLLSISMDPTNDTPEVLARSAENFNADEQHWTFATGNVEAIRQFGSAVGLEFVTTKGQISHNLRTIVIDADGHIRHIFRGNTWTPQELVAEMRSALLSHR